MILQRNVYLSVVALLALVAFPAPATAQFVRGGSVGGVKIDAQGTVQDIQREDLTEQLRLLRQQAGPAGGELATGLRMVSLKRLQAAIQLHLAQGDMLPAELQYMAGLQRVQYLFVYPELNDIVIAGPAEPWAVRDADAAVVGVNSHRPPVHLEDLLVAFQAVESAQREGISCSIEPTPEGQKRLAAMLSRVPRGTQPAQLEPAMRQAFGPQLVKLTGVATDSHYAQVMVAADYQMKRLAMNLTPSPIGTLPSYMELSRSSSHSANSNPRWWMACNYDSLLRTPDRMAWELTGQGVKTMTETDIVNADGTRGGKGKTDPKAQQWANLMTSQFDQLSQHQAIFGQLRNLMDLTVIAALVFSEGLDQKANCELNVLLGKNGGLSSGGYMVPQSVAPQCSFIRGQSGWVVSASGGVSIDYASTLSKQQEAKSMSVNRSTPPADVTQWWWNG